MTADELLDKEVKELAYVAPEMLEERIKMVAKNYHDNKMGEFIRAHT